MTDIKLYEIDPNDVLAYKFGILGVVKESLQDNFMPTVALEGFILQYEDVMPIYGAKAMVDYLLNKEYLQLLTKSISSKQVEISGFSVTSKGKAWYDEFDSLPENSSFPVTDFIDLELYAKLFITNYESNWERFKAIKECIKDEAQKYEVVFTDMDDMMNGDGSTDDDDDSDFLKSLKPSDN